VEAKQLDEGIVDTFVSVGVKNGAHTSVSISASDSARIRRAAHLELLLDELANLVSFGLRLVEPQLAGSNYPSGVCKRFGEVQTRVQVFEEEFGWKDADVTRISRDAARVLLQALMHVLTRAKNQREISSDAGLDSMADFFESTLAGIRIAAKAGKSRRSLRNMAAFASRAYIASDCRTAADRRQVGDYRFVRRISTDKRACIDWSGRGDDALRGPLLAPRMEQQSSLFD
jgi:hypothetical protein